MTNAPSKSKAGFTLIELLVVLGVIALLVAFLFPAVRTGGPAAARSTCKSNLKQIGLALHNYAETYGGLPPAYTVDADGNRLHSWRTLLLPFVDQKPLYERIDLSKPWNDPANAEAYEATIHTYLCPSTTTSTYHTTYLAIVGENNALHPTRPRPFSEISDGTNETLLVIEVPSAQAVHWMSPMDADEELLLSISSSAELPHQGGFHAAFADGAVRFISADVAGTTRKALATINGNEKIEPGSY